MTSFFRICFPGTARLAKLGLGNMREFVVFLVHWLPDMKKIQASIGCFRSFTSQSILIVLLPSYFQLRDSSQGKAEMMKRLTI
ncbi:hypothetical protein MUK42_33543 [Musa troglodytarum]|uniref:Uncharacterized protein n=1 Tax=Musa troglodytarum TaxID=320322 RepID=A0A9E7JT42_9LILI|nr:hypothetical protein MUK42_33543 [Musa troglodytarum]